METDLPGCRKVGRSGCCSKVGLGEEGRKEVSFNSFDLLRVFPDARKDELTASLSSTCFRLKLASPEKTSLRESDGAKGGRKEGELELKIEGREEKFKLTRCSCQALVRELGRVETWQDRNPSCR